MKMAAPSSALRLCGRGAGWIGYLSTTGVYGDLAGGWAFEETPVNPQSREAMNRAKAEEQWLSVGARIFRLPGIYGPGRSQLERVREPGARRIVKPGQVFSRAHVADIASALRLAIATRNPTRVFNICDDEPAPAEEVLVYAAQLLDLAPPPAVAHRGGEPLAGSAALLCRVQARLERQGQGRPWLAARLPDLSRGPAGLSSARRVDLIGGCKNARTTIRSISCGRDSR